MRILDCLAAAAALVIAASAPASAQTAGEYAAQPWRVACSDATEEAEARCLTFQPVMAQPDEEGAEPVQVMGIRVQPRGDGAYMLVLVLPHGLTIPAGVRAAIDGGTPRLYAIQTSDAAGVYARGPLTEDVLADMRAGEQLSVRMTRPGGDLVVNAPLEGFSRAYDQMIQGVPSP